MSSQPLFTSYFLPGLLLSNASHYYGFDGYFAFRAEPGPRLNLSRFLLKKQKRPGITTHQPDLSQRGPKQPTTGQQPAIQRASLRRPEPATSPRVNKDPRYAPM